jgi:hypothetical protein
MFFSKLLAGAALTSMGLLGGLATTANATTAPTPCHVTTGACVSLSQQKAWLLKNGQIVFGPVSVATGRKAYPTPAGNFHVLYKQRMHYSREFHNAPMPYSVFFYHGDAFHTGSLRIPSHGCIHLSTAASQRFYSTLRVGDAVQVVR